MALEGGRVGATEVVEHVEHGVDVLVLPALEVFGRVVRVVGLLLGLGLLVGVEVRVAPVVPVRGGPLSLLNNLGLGTILCTPKQSPTASWCV